MYELKIQFDLLDIGKIMWLYVDFGAHNFMVPITYNPIEDMKSDPLRVREFECNVGLIDFKN